MGEVIYVTDAVKQAEGNYRHYKKVYFKPNNGVHITSVTINFTDVTVYKPKPETNTEPAISEREETSDF